MEIQRSIGSPAQAADVEGLRTEVSHIDKQIEALEKKIEVLTLVCSCLLLAFATTPQFPADEPKPDPGFTDTPRAARTNVNNASSSSTPSSERPSSLRQCQIRLHGELEAF